MTAWYNYIIIQTLEGSKQPLLVSGAPVHCFQNCFKLFQVVQIVIMSGQQPASGPMIATSLINKVGDQFDT